jgi:hypothetical protein
MSTISILGGTQALEYELESRLAQLKADDLVEELFDEFDENPDSPELIAAELLALDTDTAILFEPLHTWERPEENCLAVSYVACNQQPFAVALESTQQLSAAAAGMAPPKTAKRVESPKPKQEPNYRLLFGLACASLVGVSGMAAWLLGQLYGIKSAPIVAAAPAPVTVDPATMEFAKYLDQSLATLSEQVAAQQAANSTLAGVPMGLPGGNGQPLERVYVPVYQPAPQSAASAVPVPASPTASVPLPPPPGIPTTRLSTPRLPTNVQGYLPNPGRRPARPAPIATALATPVPSPAAPVAPLANSTLIGVLELGERSMAMVEVNGATQRISIGQSLNSGWQLVQVADQKAVLQRGGEIRSLTVGQKF